MRLSDAHLSSLPAAVGRPDYSREHTRIGIVHLGAGAFHRAHQAAYVDALLAAEPDWAISAVSLHNPEVGEALQPQDGLYTLALLDETPSFRVIGSIRELLCAPLQPAAVLARLRDPAVRILSLTVTEKGYCLREDGLDFEHPDIAHDVVALDPAAHQHTALRSAIGYVVAGLRARRALGLPPYTVLSCDNLADNGGRLRRASLQFAERIDAGLARWIEREVSFPRSMVDSITPATDAPLRERVDAALGLHDAWPVQREPFTQWVIEDRFCSGRPAFERVGVVLSNDIAGYDRAKLRLLNGPHSALAYLGSLMQFETVAEAMQAPALGGFIEALMRESIAPTLVTPGGFDAAAYIDSILARFRNPAIRHRLAQIAWDGSQKLPVRLLGTIADALAANRPIDALCLPLAAWVRYVRRQALAGVALVDPLADQLSALGRASKGRAEDDVAAFLALDGVFAPLSGEPRFVEAMIRACVALGDATPAAVARALVACTGDACESPAIG
jgi:fructuronate reductase